MASGSNNTGVSVNGSTTYTAKRVYANIGATDVLEEGMPLCYDSDNATAAHRTFYVEKPTLANLDDFAGVVAPGQIRRGPGYVDIIEWEGDTLRGVKVWTDESIAVGDLLGPIPETFVLGKCVIGKPVFVATAAADRSTTAGTVTGDYGQRFLDEPRLIARYFDDFLAGGGVSSTADAGRYVLTGTGATGVYADALGPEAAAAAQGAGVLTINGLTTGFEANLQLNGEPFRLDKSLFFRARVAPQTANSESRIFVGLNLAGSTDMGDATGTDYIGFRMLNTALDFIYAKDGTSTALQTATGATSAAIAAPVLAAGTFVEVAFLVRLKTTGSYELTIWANGTKITHTLVTADICDNESLTFALAADDSGGDSNISASIDRIEINNYVGLAA